jgi:large subunit ribosomal protein L54
VLKDKPDPIALPDDQYPSWLWTILDDSSAKLESDKKAGRADAADVDFKLQKRKLRAQ